jgi:thiamine biosynthesis lipoprotein ApbE
MATGSTGADLSATSASWRAIGTSVHLIVTEPAALEPACRMLHADLAAVDAACSRFRADSEIVALDRVPQVEGMTGPVTVSPLLAEALGIALRAAAFTGGDVDPTVGGAMAAMGYDRDFDLVRRDGPPVTLTVRSVPGWREVQFDEQARLLSLPAGLRLDLGATAKAWAADRAAEQIAAELGCGILVNLGGDIAVAGEGPADGWRIRVQDVTGRPEDPPDGNGSGDGRTYRGAVLTEAGHTPLVADDRVRRYRGGLTPCAYRPGTPDGVPVGRYRSSSSGMTS